jgi:hypothetical protein
MGALQVDRAWARRPPHPLPCSPSSAQVGANAEAFTIAVAAEGFIAWIFGTYIERIGPFKCALYATILCPGAWAFAALGGWQRRLEIIVSLFSIPLGVSLAFGFVGE